MSSPARSAGGVSAATALTCCCSPPRIARPGALAGPVFGPEDVARIRPGIVYASLSAYGHAGPWAQRRGFDSLVQTTSGFNDAEGRAAGIHGPRGVGAQTRDHATR